MVNPTRSRGAAWPADLLSTLTWVLLASVGAEFVLLRILNRMADRFPPGVRGQIAEDLVFAGTVAYNLAFLFAVVLVAVVAHTLWDRHRAVALLLFLWIVVLVVVPVAGPGVAPVLAASGLFAAAIMVALVVRGVALHDAIETANRRSPGLRSIALRIRRPVFLVLVLGTYLAALYLRAGDALATIGAGPPARPQVYGAAEVLPLAAAFAAVSVFAGRPTLKTVAAATVTVLVVSVPAVLRPDILPLIAFWSVGFQLHLPLPLYLAGLWCYVFALVHAAERDRGSGYALAGLLLVALGGRLLADYYAIQLAIVALLFLTLDRELRPEVPASGEPPVG